MEIDSIKYDHSISPSDNYSLYKGEIAKGYEKLSYNKFLEPILEKFVQSVDAAYSPNKQLTVNIAALQGQDLVRASELLPMLNFDESTYRAEMSAYSVHFNNTPVNFNSDNTTVSEIRTWAQSKLNKTRARLYVTSSIIDEMKRSGLEHG